MNINFAEKVEKCLEWIAVKNANSASVVCSYEPDIPKVLKNMVEKKTQNQNLMKKIRR